MNYNLDGKSGSSCTYCKTHAIDTTGKTKCLSSFFILHRVLLSGIDIQARLMTNEVVNLKDHMAQAGLQVSGLNLALLHTKR